MLDLTLVFSNRRVRCPICNAIVTREAATGRPGFDVLMLACTDPFCDWTERVGKDLSTGLAMVLPPMRVRGKAKGSGWLHPVSNVNRACATPGCRNQANASGWCRWCIADRKAAKRREGAE